MNIMYRYITVYGSPYERGFGYGSQARDLIKNGVEYYINLWINSLNISRDKILDKARSILDLINNLDPDLYEEIRGIADGSELSIEEITALNARYEFMRMVFIKEGCTSAVVLPELTSDKHVYIGQNWDYKPEIFNNMIILDVKDSNTRILTHVEAGCLSRTGFNSYGVGLCVNSLALDIDRFEASIPFHILARIILNSKSLDEAVYKISNLKLKYSYNFLIASSDGRSIDLEVYPRGINYITPIYGIIVHTNHFIKIYDYRDEVPKVYPDTVTRYDRLREILRSRDKIDLEYFKDAFKDHSNYPNSICRHLDPKTPKELQCETLASIIMNLNDLKMYVSRGQPCKTQHYTFQL